MVAEEVCVNCYISNRIKETCINPHIKYRHSSQLGSELRLLASEALIRGE
jgi:hypothetical protein